MKTKASHSMPKAHRNHRWPENDAGERLRRKRESTTINPNDSDMGVTMATASKVVESPKNPGVEPFDLSAKEFGTGRH